MGGVGRLDFASSNSSRIPCECVGHLIYFPRFLTRESADPCLKRRNKMSAPSTPRGRKRSRASPPRKYLASISLFASLIYSPFRFSMYTVAKANLCTKISRSKSAHEAFKQVKSFDRSQT